MAGLTTSGFEIPSVDDIVAEIEADLKANVDANINVEADSLLGQVITITASKLHDVWELAEAVYHAAYPDTANGVSLAYVSAITGTIKKSATKSTVTATVNLNNGTTLPIGSGASVSGDSTMSYVTTEAVSNTTGSAANFTVAMEASVAGSHIRANTGTLTVIDTPVAGWNSVTNAADSVAGTDEETDADLRERRESELARPGTSPLDALRADLLDITKANAYTSDVTNALVYENVTTSPANAGGLPIWKIEAVVLGGEDADVAQVLFDGKAAGVGTYGTSSASVTDTSGNTHTVYFSRPTPVPITIVISVRKSADTDLSDAEIITAVKEAIADGYGDTVEMGEDVYLSDVIAAANGVQGVESVVVSGATPTINASASDYTISVRSLATFDTTDITVTVV